MPNVIPDWLPWMQPAGRLIWSIASVPDRHGDRLRPDASDRSPTAPSTWAECIAGAVGVFAMMTLAFAVIPHEWITFSDGYLQWDTTQFLFRSGQDVFGLGIVNWPFNFDKHNIRDIIVAVIYGLGMGLSVGLFVDVAEARSRRSRRPRPPRRGGRASAVRCVAKRRRPQPRQRW